MREASRRGHGIVTVEDLSALDVSRQMIQTRVKSGRLIAVLNRAFALPGATLEMRGRARAAVSSAGPNVCVSHRSALALHGLIAEKGPVHLLGEAGAFRHAGARHWTSNQFEFGVECHQTRHLPREHITQIDGIPVTTVERAVRDYSATATPSEITKVLAQGEKERSLCWGKLRAIVAASNGHKGMAMLQNEIDRWLEAFVDTSSDPEVDFLRMIRKNTLPIPEVNQRIGSYIPDFLWRHLNLAVELDPYGTHSGLASHRQDHRKGIELEISGLRVIRFTGEDLYQYEPRTATELRIVMEQQASLLRCPLFPSVGETRNTV
jgi:very-short-patch-repair endonuclease